MAWIADNYRTDLVSVIVPVYNRGYLIPATLDSVHQQTHRPIELVVADDGSTDGTADIVQKWVTGNCAQETRFSVRYVRQDNAGPAAARNLGLRECSGEFIQFLDSDDLLHREKLTKQVAALRQSHADFCVCNYQAFQDDLSALGAVFDFYHRSHGLDDFPAQYPMNTPAPLYRRATVCSNGPWDVRLGAAEDFEYNFRIMARGAKGIWLNEVLLYVRKHGNAERIQARPLATRYRPMCLGLILMETEAIDRGVCSRKLLHSLGLRAYQYYRSTKGEGSLLEADVFLRHAQPRLFWTTRVSLALKQILPNSGLKMAVLAKGVLARRNK